MSKGQAAKFGTHEDKHFAVKVDAVDNLFWKGPFGRSYSDMKTLADFFNNHPEKRTAYVDAKGKPTLASVKKWVKEQKPKQFYAIWR